MFDKRFFTKYAVIFQLLINVVFGYLDNDGWINVQLYHALDPMNSENFLYRGNVTIPSLSSGLSESEQSHLSDDTQQVLKNLAKIDGFYRLKADVILNKGIKKTFLASSKACGLVENSLNDVLWISVDGSGSIMSIAHTITISANAIPCSKDASIATIDQGFSTDIFVRHTELAPIPDTTSFLQKVEREREARERGDVRDNRGFFAKYWMYIVPVVLLVFISGATNQDSGK